MSPDGELGGRLGRLVERVAQRVGQHRHGRQRDRRVRRALDPHHAVDDLQVAGVGLEGVARDPQRLRAHLAGGERDRVAAHDRRPRGEGADGVAEPAGVAGHDLDVLERHAELVGGDLRERREVALPLGGQAGRDLHLAGRLDDDVRALVRPDAGALDVAGEADADLAAVGPRRLGVCQRPSSQPTRSLSFCSDAGKSPGVVDQRPAVLERQVVVVGHLVRGDEVAQPHLGAVEPEPVGDRVHRALHREDALRPAGAAVGRDDHGVGVERPPLAAVGAGLVRAEQLGRR